MKRLFLLFSFLCYGASLMAAYQYNTKGNQLYLTFDSATTLSFDLGRSGKDKDHENFIDRGENVVDYGWYNIETGATGSLANGQSVTFNENDKIGLYVKDKNGEVFTTTKKKPIPGLGDDITWGKANDADGSIALYGGNKGSNGTHEYYVFKVNTIANNNGKTPSGQPLPGIIATLIIGGGVVFYLLKRKKLYASKEETQAA